MLKVLLLFFVVTSTAWATPEETMKKINFVKAYIKDHHLADYQKVTAWVRSGREGPRPTISPKLHKAFNHLQRLYKSYLDEKTFSTEEGKKKIQSYSSYFQDLSETYSHKVNPQHKNFLITAGFYRIAEKVKITGANFETTKDTAFTGGTLGAAWRSHPRPYFWRFDAEYFYGKSELEDENTGYARESVINQGFIFTPAFGYSFFENVYGALGIPFVLTDMSHKSKNNLEAQLKSSFKMGAEARIGYDFRNSFLTEGRMGILNYGNYFGISLAYQF